MAEELAAGGIDAVGAAAEIDLVEIEFENLLLRELGLESHRQHGLAQLAIDRAVRIEEHVARKLLRDRRSRRDPFRAGHPDIDRASEADRIDANVRIEAPVLDGDHGILHRLRDFAPGQPLAITRTQLDDFAAVPGADDDGLAVPATHEGGIARHRTGGEEHRAGQRESAQQRQPAAPHQKPPRPQPPAAARAHRPGLPPRFVFPPLPGA